MLLLPQQECFASIFPDALKGFWNTFQISPFEEEVSIHSSSYQRHSGKGQGLPVCGMHCHHEGPYLIHLIKMVAYGYSTLPLVSWEGVQENPY